MRSGNADLFEKPSANCLVGCKRCTRSRVEANHAPAELLDVMRGTRGPKLVFKLSQVFQGIMLMRRAARHRFKGDAAVNAGEPSADKSEIELVAALGPEESPHTLVANDGDRAIGREPALQAAPTFAGRWALKLELHDVADTAATLAHATRAEGNHGRMGGRTPPLETPLSSMMREGTAGPAEVSPGNLMRRG